MKKIYLTLLAAAFSLTFQSSAQILCIMCYDQNDSISSGVNNLLLNGSFENSNCASGYILDVFCPNSSYYSCNLDNWICTGGGSQTYVCVFDSTPTTRSTLVDGLYAVYMGNYFCAPCTAGAFGDTSCFVTNNDCELSGIPPGFPTHDPTYGGNVGVSIEQTVNGLNIGNTYVLEFWVGGESSGFPDPGMFAIDVGFGNNLLRCHQTPYGIGVGTRYIIEFNATSTSQTIKFTSWGHVCNSCTEAVIDQVRLYSIAELNPNIPPCIGSTINALFTAPNHICPGTCTNFNNLSTNATSFLWSFPGATPSTSTDVDPTNVCYNAPGTYPVSLIATNVNGSDTLTLNNYITVYPYPAPQGISQSGDTLFANQGAVSYQWYLTGVIIPGATNYFYVAMQSGDYNVVATDANNCEVEAVIYNVIAKIHEPFLNPQFKIFPNPVSDKLIIQPLSQVNEVSEIAILNLLGEMVLDVHLPTAYSSLPTIDCRFLQPGIYWIEVSDGSLILRSRFVKQ
ncbi:MAG: T9SS type A sorting domain-containing protein [Bacteroidota bacterium]